jgi:predicted O-methyltransferase YrrM
MVKRVVATANSLRNPETPWIVSGALAHVERWLRRDHLAFEWGTGLSTAWLAKRAAKVVAVEHDPLWQRKTIQSLEEKSLQNVEVRLARELDYVAQIETFSDKSIDFILVDGIQAGAALAISMKKLKNGGMLVLNGAHRVLPSDSTTPDARSREDGPDEEIAPAELIELMRWRLKWESDGQNDTAVFWKP